MPYSHHSHSGQFCRHAIGLLEDVVKEALDQGFEVYGLTEHAPRFHVKDLYPEEVIRLRLYVGMITDVFEDRYLCGGFDDTIRGIFG